MLLEYWRFFRFFTDANMLSYTLLVILTGHVEIMLQLGGTVRINSLLSVQGLFSESSPSFYCSEVIFVLTYQWFSQLTCCHA